MSTIWGGEAGVDVFSSLLEAAVDESDEILSGQGFELVADGALKERSLAIVEHVQKDPSAVADKNECAAHLLDVAP